jgi:hypothetical protein
MDPETPQPDGRTADDEEPKKPVHHRRWVGLITRQHVLALGRGEHGSRQWSALAALFWAAALSAGMLALIVWLLVRLFAGTQRHGPEITLSLVFVAAAVVLILAVAALTIVLKRLQLVNEDEAMGLPRGSIRAVIALMLILLFFIAAVFLFNTTRRVPPTIDELRTLERIDAARLATIPTELIQRSVVVTAADGTTLYDVTLLPDPMENQAADDLAKQLVTVLGTLVTAVAAFYFGANSVSSALKSQAELRQQEKEKDRKHELRPRSLPA